MLSFIRGLFGPPDVRKLKVKRDVQGLIEALDYEGDWSIPQTAAEALGELGDSNAIAPLCSALRDAVPEVREAAVAALVKIGMPALAFLSVMLEDALPEVRETAVATLVKFGVPAGAPLCSALGDAVPEVREAAAEGLVEIGTPAINPLLAALRSRNPDVRRLASGLLVRIGAPAVAPLCSCLKDSDPDVRRRIAGALQEIGDLRAIEPLCGALEDPDPTVRHASSRALGKFRSTRALEPLFVALKDSDSGVRTAVCEALGEFGSLRAVESLCGALEDPNDHVITAAVEALGKIRGARLNDAALAALLSYVRSSKKLPNQILDYIVTFEVEPAIDILVKQGQWHYLWPKHKLLVLRSRDRCQGIANFMATSISAESYPRVESYNFLTPIVQEYGAAIDERTLRAIVCLDPPKDGWADEGYEALQAAGDRARKEAYGRLIEAGKTELRRRGLKPE